MTGGGGTSSVAFVIERMNFMRTLSIDIESFSSVNLQKSGVYKYASLDDFEILLFGYSVDGGDVQVVDLVLGEEIPQEILDALKDDEVIKWAFNASFERICLSAFLGMPVGEYLNPKSWRCSMIWSATLGLPLSLEGVGAVLGLEKQKLTEGKNLIKYFCVPCAATKANGGRTRNLPMHDMEKWNSFKAYNLRDVETEMGIQQDNPNSVQQMKNYLAENGLEMESLGKKEVAEILKVAPEHLREVLSLRQQLAKSSVKKYTAMQNAVCSDGRARGMFQFYGANRTGRFSGRLIQLQNLPQNHIFDLSEARAIVRSGDYEVMDMLYEDIPDTLSQLIRTAFVPQNGRKFIVADFSAIEARVLSWLAGEKWRMEVFAKNGDIYCETASRMFGVPVEKHGLNGHLRQKGKQAELSCGYGGSVSALKAMGALAMGMQEEELQPLVDSWRAANPHIVDFWWEVDRAVKMVVKQRIPAEVCGIKMYWKSGFLFLVLPSGRKLAYVKPRMGENKFGGESVTYEGVGATKKWERLESYGPKFVENIVQAISRDVLIYAMQTLRNCSIVAHVHDEIIIEADKGMSLETVCEQMGRTPPWAKGLILNADGYECEFYKKD